MDSTPRYIFSFLKPLANRYLGFLLSLFVYSFIVERGGGVHSVFSAWRLEIPLLLYLYWYLNLITRPGRWQWLVAGAPIFLVYGTFDLYHLLLGRLPRLAEVTELPEMFQVMPHGVKLFAGLLAGLPLVVLLWSLRWRRFRPLFLGALPLLVILGAVVVYPAFFMMAFEKTQKNIDWCSDKVSAGTNGRIGMALYHEARRQVSLEKTSVYRGNSFFQGAFDKAVGKINALRTKGNVHLVVLESFIDPGLLRGVGFSRDPMHPSFAALFKNKGGLSVSPVFGGATAQAEFEVLCGVPAMRELSGIEFDVFTGAKTLCLPNILTQGGYHAVASNAFLPDFFNATNAYSGMGFEKIYFPREYAPGRATYFTTGDVTGEQYMFDGDLLSQNLAYVAQWKKDYPGSPLFNYILSIYGHTPHEINPEKRPRVVEVLGEVRDEQLERVVNQYYYRTEAIAAYVKELIRIDPKSIIILISDHLPSLTFGPNTYRDLDYLDKTEDYIHLNRIYIVENGRAVQFDTIHHYDVPRIILSYVTQAKFDQLPMATAGARTEPPGIPSYRDQYMTIMANAMHGESLFPEISFLSGPDGPAADSLPGAGVTGAEL